MTFASILLHAPHVGVREFKARLSRFLKGRSPLIITEHGTPVEVVIPYAEAMEMVDLIDEVTDLQTLNAVKEGREAVRKGVKGIPVRRLFNKMRRKSV